MMDASPLTSTILFHIGPIPISRAVMTTWGLMLALPLGSWLLTRQLGRDSDRLQAILETVVVGILDQITEVAGKSARSLLPLLATLFLFIATANSISILPGIEAPTARIETAAALAAVVFISVHFYGIRARGLLSYLAGFAKPKLIMLPLNLLSEITRTLSLMVRLFGNVMSGEFMIALVLALAGLFVPIPLMALELLLGLVQAYIFAILAGVFIGAAINAQQQN
ncbi:MAG: F0F1 ATP synthase subunit A [Nisaea sp.]